MPDNIGDPQPEETVVAAQREAAQQDAHFTDDMGIVDETHEDQADIAPQDPRRRSWIARLLRGLGWCVLAGVASCILLLCVFRFAGPPVTLNMVGRSLQGVSVTRQAVSLDRISPHLVRAVIAAEDSRFCLHDGFDMEAIRSAIAEKEKRGYLRGASTLSQQTAKNVFLWNGGGWIRKGGETVMTGLIELVWPKRRIMEIYLNVAEWGDGYYGAEAAAQGRFGVSAAQLTPWQASLLAASLPNPNKWRVDPPGPYVTGRARQIMGRMNVVQSEKLDACVLTRRK